jgi:probable rRNA maturation factor
MPISLASSLPSARALLPPLRRLVRSALAARGMRPGRIDVLLADDRALRALNRRWRRLDRATDVLSFGYDGNGAGSPRNVVSGDLAISLERVSEQARRFRCTLGEELARLVVHGALHLAGLDHKTAPERRAMRALEDRIMNGARAEIGAFDRGMGDPARTRRP